MIYHLFFFFLSLPSFATFCMDKSTISPYKKKCADPYIIRTIFSSDTKYPGWTIESLREKPLKQENSLSSHLNKINETTLCTCKPCEKKNSNRKIVDNLDKSLYSVPPINQIHTIDFPVFYDNSPLEHKGMKKISMKDPSSIILCRSKNKIFIGCEKGLETLNYNGDHAAHRMFHDKPVWQLIINADETKLAILQGEEGKITILDTNHNIVTHTVEQTRLVFNKYSLFWFGPEENTFVEYETLFVSGMPIRIIKNYETHAQKTIILSKNLNMPDLRPANAGTALSTTSMFAACVPIEKNPQSSAYQLVGDYYENGHCTVESNSLESCPLCINGYRSSHGYYLPCIGANTALAFHPNSPVMASLSCTKSVRFWNYITKQYIGKTEEHFTCENLLHKKELFFSDNGQLLVAFVNDKVMFLCPPQNNIIFFSWLLKHVYGPLPVNIIQKIMHNKYKCEGLIDVNLLELSKLCS